MSILKNILLLFSKKIIINLLIIIYLFIYCEFLYYY
uniref:Uncharacterized protein n=1 Tax=viral metagenome TaxID=1070528 RepID=A0A6C0H8M9_9ZZZZ